MYCFVYFQDAFDAATKLEPQHPEPLASSDSADQGKWGFYNARIALHYTSISCITYWVKQLIKHTFISWQFNKQVYCFVYFQASEEEENNIKVINIKEAGPVQFKPLGGG